MPDDKMYDEDWPHMETTGRSSWRLQLELKTRLSEIDKKLDRLASQVSSCLDGTRDCRNKYGGGGRISSNEAEDAPTRVLSSGNLSQMPQQLSPKDQNCAETTITLDETFKRMGTATHGLHVKHSHTLDPQSLLSFHRSGLAEDVWMFLEEPKSSRGACWFYRLWLLFITFSVLFTICQNLQPPLVDAVAAGIIEAVFDASFAVELVVRYIVCTHRWGFVQSPYNMVDALVVLPIILRSTTGFNLHGDEESFVSFFLLCIVPVLRLLKLLRRFQQFHLFVRVVSSTSEALKFLLYMMFVIVLVFSSSIYIVEPRDTISSMPMAMWLTVVTMTTVGYGDITPATSAGRGILSVLIVSSVLYMALPIGILGNAFTQVWRERDHILLANRTSERLLEWGLSPNDIPTLFRHYDSQGGGELSLPQFRKFSQELRLHMDEDRLVELFESLDKDGGGAIDYKEFLRALFPSTYHELYSLQRKKHIQQKLWRQQS